MSSDHRGVVLRRVRADAIAAFRLGAIQRLIGAMIKFVRIAVLAPFCKADRSRDIERAPGLAHQERLFLDREARPFGDARRRRE